MSKNIQNYWDTFESSCARAKYAYYSSEASQDINKDLQVTADRPNQAQITGMHPNKTQKYIKGQRSGDIDNTEIHHRSKYLIQHKRR